MRMDEESEKVFTMVANKSLYSPRRVPHGGLNITPHSQWTMGQKVLAGLAGVICKVWVDAIVIRGCTPEELMQNLLAVV